MDFNKKSVFLFVLFILVLLSCSCNKNVVSNKVYGTVQKYYHDDHSGVNVSVMGTSETGYHVSQTTKTDTNGNWVLENMPSGLYTIRFTADYGGGSQSGSVNFYQIEKLIDVNKTIKIDVKMTFYMMAQLINYYGSDGIKITSPIEWEYTEHKEEADLFFVGDGTVEAVNGNGIQLLEEFGGRDELKMINEVPLDGYKNKLTIREGSSALIAFKTKNGYYAKACVECEDWLGWRIC